VTPPRQILKGASYLVTRRCSQRQFLLKPSPIVDAVFGYVLAVAARRYGILLHVYCVLSNHLHIVLTDPLGRLPDFEQFLDSLLARALNAWYGRWEHFWAPSTYSAVTLVTSEDVLEKCAYTLANPVAAGLVEQARHWPGRWSSPDLVGGQPEVVQRPEHFFSPSGQMPEAAELQLVVPSGFASTEAFRAALVERLAEHENAARKAIASEGRRFMGAKRVLAQRHTDYPGKGEPRRELNPRLAAGDKWKRIEALLRLKEFVAEYREALRKFRSGARKVVFPEGTYLLRVSLGVACAGSG
jgi:REP element-mobilizing transposase RayT